MEKRKVFIIFMVAVLLSACACKKEEAGIVTETEYVKMVEVKEKDYIDSSGNFLYYREGDKEFYGYMEQNHIIKLVPQKLEKQITFHGITGKILATYCLYEGESWIVKYENNPVTEDGDEYDFFINSVDERYAYLEMVRNAQKEAWSYPLIYNLETDEIIDFLKDVRINGEALVDESQLKICKWEISEKKMYVSCNDVIYKIDIETQEVSSLNEFVKEEKIADFQIFDEGYFMLIPIKETYKGVYFNTASENKEVLFEEITTKKTKSKTSIELVRIIGDDALLIRRNGVLYCREQNSREEWEISGWNDEECTLREQIDSRVLLSGENSFGILDLEEKAYREITIEKEDKFRECRLCCDNAFTVCTRNGSLYCLTKYKWKQ